MLFKAHKKLKSAPDLMPTSINSEIWARWKNNWERPENKTLSAKNSFNRRGGGDKAEATHIGCSVPHARTMQDLVSIQLFMQYNIELVYYFLVNFKSPFVFQEQSKGQKPTPCEIFARTHRVFDTKSRNCSQWTNTQSQQVNVMIF